MFIRNNVIFTGRNEVLAKVIFSQASVIHSVHRGGGYFFRGGGVLHRNTVNVRPVRILLECILVEIEKNLEIFHTAGPNFPINVM